MKTRFEGLIAISDVLDDRYQKLSDKYHNLELSHNRKKKALVEIFNICTRLFHSVYFTNPQDDFQFSSGMCCIAKLCEDALFCDGKEKTCIMRKKDINNLKKSDCSLSPEKKKKN